MQPQLKAYLSLFELFPFPCREREATEDLLEIEDPPVPR